MASPVGAAAIGDLSEDDLGSPITAAKVVEIVTPCRSLGGAPPNCSELDALGRHIAKHAIDAQARQGDY